MRLSARELGVAAAFALAMALAYVALNEPVLDEAVGAAQVLTCAVRYPAGHPHDVYFRSALSLPNHVAAWLYALAPDVALQCSVRNALTSFVSVLGPTLLGTLLTRSSAWGLFAGALWSSEALGVLDGVYPLHVDPVFHSHGQIGQSLALIAVSLWLGRWGKSAALLTGLLPVLHAGMVPIVWAWSAAFVALGRSRPRGSELRGTARTFALGLGACVAFAIWTSSQAGIAPAQGPYAVPDDGGAAVANFVRFTDPHRAAPEWLSLAYGFHLLAFASLAAFLADEHRRLKDGETENGAAVRWALGFALLAWSVTIVATSVQRVVPLPAVLSMLMPGRSSNLAALALPALIAAVLARCAAKLPAREGAGLALAAAALLAGACVRWMTYAGSVRQLLLFVALGTCAGAIAWTVRSDGRRFAMAAVALAALVAGAAWLSPSWQPSAWTAVAAVATFVACFAARRLPLEAPRVVRAALALAALALAALALAAVTVPARERGLDGSPRSDLASDESRELAARLAQLTRPDELVLTPAWSRFGVQLHAARPALFEPDTLWMPTYLSELSAVTASMTRDLYGIDYSDERRIAELAAGARFRIVDPRWSDAWRSRSGDDWTRLGAKYSFRCVLSDRDTPLDLPLELETPHWRLYALPVR